MARIVNGLQTKTWQSIRCSLSKRVGVIPFCRRSPIANTMCWAGSDTTSGILTFLFFFLLSHPATYAKLQAELDGHFPDRDGPLDPATLASLPFLNAVLKEALRLGTPFGGLARVVPAGGAELEGMHVPGGTVVSVPVYAEHVSAAHFWPAPTQFIPERWLAGGLGPDSVCEEAAWIPFSFGERLGCLFRAHLFMCRWCVEVRSGVWAGTWRCASCRLSRRGSCWSLICGCCWGLRRRSLDGIS